MRKKDLSPFFLISGGGRVDRSLLVISIYTWCMGGSKSKTRTRTHTSIHTQTTPKNIKKDFILTLRIWRPLIEKVKVQRDSILRERQRSPNEGWSLTSQRRHPGDSPSCTDLGWSLSWVGPVPREHRKTHPHSSISPFSYDMVLNLLNRFTYSVMKPTTYWCRRTDWVTNTFHTQ